MEWLAKSFAAGMMSSGSAGALAMHSGPGSGSATSSSAAPAMHGSAAAAAPIQQPRLPFVTPAPSAAPVSAAAAAAPAVAPAVARQCLVAGVNRIQSSRNTIMATYSLTGCIGLAAVDLDTGWSAFTHYNTLAMMGADKTTPANNLRTSMLAKLRGHNPDIVAGRVRYHIALGAGWKVIDPTAEGPAIRAALATAFSNPAILPGYSSFAAFDPQAGRFVGENEAGMQPVVDAAKANWAKNDNTGSPI
jgi:hypothetical protein